MAIEDFQSKIDQFRFNPKAIYRMIINEVVERSGGSKDILDATSPFNLAIEAIAETGGAQLARTEMEMRKLYPVLAESWSDLYRHMSDVDYLDRFCTPANATIIFAFSKEEFISKAIATGVGNIRKLVIPRHTSVTVGGATFTLQYPIEIRLMGHGGIHVVYDGDIDSPLQTLTSNLVEWKEVLLNNVRMLCLYVPMDQMLLVSHTDTLNSATPFKRTYAVSDQFYYARVFMRSSGGSSWTELLTTHSDQTFDVLKPTALLTLDESGLTVRIPPVYYARENLLDELRVDIYSSKGNLQLDLGSQDVRNYVTQWRDLDSDDTSVYSAPLNNFSTLTIWSISNINGGTDGVDFETMRERVINNSSSGIDQPITSNQLSTRLKDAGFGKVLDVDNLGQRTILATKPIPAPDDGGTSSGIAATIATLSTTLADLVQHSAVHQHSTNRYTILPDIIYDLENGVPTLLTQAEVDAIKAQTPETIMNLVNERSLGYSPFHYVLNAANSQFSIRPYYLDAPAIVSKTFVIENDTLGLQIATDTYRIDRTEAGYRLTVKVTSGAVIKALDDDLLVPQLSIVPDDDSVRAYINGTLVGLSDNERVYQFDLDTAFDIDGYDRLQLQNFQMFDGDSRTISVNLNAEFTLVYAVTGYATVGMEASSIDEHIAQFLLTDEGHGIIEETLSIQFGYAMTYLWANSRTTLSPYGYEKYGSDVLSFWTKTVLLEDVNGDPVITDNGDGTYSATVLHAVGDPVIDEVTGEQVVLHAAGSQVFVDGEPVINAERGLLRLIDLMLLDGRYQFATDEDTLAYIASVPTVIQGWVTDTLSALNDVALEETKILYYPEIGTGTIKVIADDAEEVTIPARQGFNVTFYVDDVTYKNTDLRNALKATAVAAIADTLTNTTVSNSTLVDSIRALAGDDIVSVRISDIKDEEGNEYEVVTLTDTTSRISIGKRLTVLENGRLAIEDDLNIEFVKHRAL